MSDLYCVLCDASVLYCKCLHLSKILRGMLQFRSLCICTKLHARGYFNVFKNSLIAQLTCPSTKIAREIR